jgi:uncharacterized damage-inducible protein DinB
MDAEALIMLFKYNHYVLKTNTEGLGHEDSLIQPQPGGNCMNWVLGHILVYRNRALKLIGEEPVWSEEDAAQYARGSTPITDSSRARPLEEILAAFTQSQEQIIQKLGQLSEQELAAPADQGTVGQRLAFLQFHEAYHMGQVGLLRRLAGKEGAIK